MSGERTVVTGDRARARATRGGGSRLEAPADITDIEM